MTDDDCTVAADWVVTAWLLAAGTGGDRDGTGSAGRRSARRAVDEGRPVAARLERGAPRRLAVREQHGAPADRPCSSSAASTSASVPARRPRTTSSGTGGSEPGARSATSRRSSSGTTTGAVPTSSSACTSRTRAARDSSTPSISGAVISACCAASHGISYWALRGPRVRASSRRREAWTDSRRGILRGLPGGFVHGWRVYGRER